MGGLISEQGEYREDQMIENYNSQLACPQSSEFELSHQASPEVPPEME